MKRCLNQHAFTLIELLVVISIIALLMAILLPVLSWAQESARIAVCSSNHRQHGQLYAMFAVDYDDQVPVNYRAAARRHSFFYKVHTQNYNYARFYQTGLLNDVEVLKCPSFANFNGFRGAKKSSATTPESKHYRKLTSSPAAGSCWPTRPDRRSTSPWVALTRRSIRT